jgi:predicted transcriptional regulator
MRSVVGTLDERDMEFVETLRDRFENMARVPIAGTEEASSKDIETGADLSQSGVSIAVRTLREKGWIEERRIKGGKKGRLMKVYKLRVEIDEIIRHFERKKLHESAQVMMSIQRLKELASA